MRDSTSLESALAAQDFSSRDYCGTSYAAKLLGVSVATVQSMVERGEIEAWKTLGGHRRLSLKAINNYLSKGSPPPVVAARPDPRLRLNIMVVEDEEAIRELYQAHFDEWDMATDCTYIPSAMDALMDITTMRPDLLITDLNMPGVDGIEMLHVIKRSPHLVSMQVLVISGLPEEAIQARGGLPGDAHFHRKPINFDWLRGYVTALESANRKWR